jgi:hypothetical protein
VTQVAESPHSEHKALIQPTAPQKHPQKSKIQNPKCSKFGFLLRQNWCHKWKFYLYLFDKSQLECRYIKNMVENYLQSMCKCCIWNINEYSYQTWDPTQRNYAHPNVSKCKIPNYETIIMSRSLANEYSPNTIFPN